MNAIVSNINEQIGTQSGLENIALFGIAEAVLVRESFESEKVLPMVIEAEGECHDVLFDDAKDVSLYHRLLTKTYSTQNAKGFGDTPQREVTYDMALVVYGKRKAIDFMQLERICVGAIENVTNEAKRMKTEVLSTNFNRLEVFAGEYVGLPFPIEPDIFLFKINYKLTRVQSPCH